MSTSTYLPACCLSLDKGINLNNVTVATRFTFLDMIYLPIIYYLSNIETVREDLVLLSNKRFNLRCEYSYFARG